MNELNLDDFAAWVTEQPSDRVVDHSDIDTCAMGEYAKARGHNIGSVEAFVEFSDLMERICGIDLYGDLANFGWCCRYGKTYGDIANRIQEEADARAQR